MRVLREMSEQIPRQSLLQRNQRGMVWSSTATRTAMAVCDSPQHLLLN